MDETTTTTIQPELATWLNTTQLSKYLTVSKSTVERFKAEYGLPFSKVAQTTRYNRNQIDKWLADRQRSNAVRGRTL